MRAGTPGCFGTVLLLCFLSSGFSKNITHPNGIDESKLDPNAKLRPCDDALPQKQKPGNSIVTCSDSYDPAKGRNVTTCTLKCETGYDFNLNKFVTEYNQTCNNATGLWSGQSKDDWFGKWDDVCTKVTNPVFRRATTSVVMVNGNVTVCPTIDNINAALHVLMEDNINLIPCIQQNTCKKEPTMTTCTLVSSPAALNITFVYSQVGDLAQTQIMEYFMSAILYIIEVDNFYLTIQTSSKKRATTHSYNARADLCTSQVTFGCAAGYGQIAKFCSQCPMGYSQQNSVCTPCPKDTYSGAQASSCTPCPPNTQTFSEKSISITDCVIKCPVKESLGAFVIPPPGWTVTDLTRIYLTCTDGYSTEFGKNIKDSYECKEEAPQCYKACSLREVPHNVMLKYPDYASMTLEHGNMTTVMCVNLIDHHVIKCNNGTVVWPKCDSVYYSYIGIRIFILFGVTTVLGIFIWIGIVVSKLLKYKEHQTFKGGNYAAVSTNIINPVQKTIVSLPILLNNFPEKVETFERGGMDRYKREFLSIPPDDPEQERKIGLASYNRKKNHPSARGIVPYDISRIVLGREETQETDYYNASFINGWKGPRAYIAAQTPMEHTVADFWRIIIDHKLKYMVNMHPSINNEEPEQYFKYWPEKDGLFDDVLIRTDSVEKFWGFTLHTVRVGYVDLDDSSFDKSSRRYPESIADDVTESKDGEVKTDTDTKEGSNTNEESLNKESKEGGEDGDVEEAEQIENKEANVAVSDEKAASDKSESTIVDGKKSAMSVTRSVMSLAKSTKSVKTVVTLIQGDREELIELESLTSTQKLIKKLRYHTSIVTRYIQFTGWEEVDGRLEPNMAKFQHMLFCIRNLKRTMIMAKSPTLVHSECGSDWASVFCGSDYILDRLISDDTIDIVGLTNAMRDQRPMMVATVDIYRFIHRFISFVITMENYEDKRYTGFWSEFDERGHEPTPEKEGQSPEEGEEVIPSPLRVVTTAVDEGRKSVMRTLSRMSQALSKSVLNPTSTGDSSSEDKDDAYTTFQNV